MHQLHAAVTAHPDSTLLVLVRSGDPNDDDRMTCLIERTMDGLRALVPEASGLSRKGLEPLTRPHEHSGQQLNVPAGGRGVAFSVGGAHVIYWQGPSLATRAAPLLDVLVATARRIGPVVLYAPTLSMIARSAAALDALLEESAAHLSWVVTNDITVPARTSVPPPQRGHATA